MQPAWNESYEMALKAEDPSLLWHDEGLDEDVELFEGVRPPSLASSFSSLSHSQTNEDGQWQRSLHLH